MEVKEASRRIGWSSPVIAAGTDIQFNTRHLHSWAKYFAVWSNGTKKAACGK
jgi:hypothetical protein